MAARPAIGADTDRLFEFLRELAKESAALEAERLLYVACTRARHQLHLTATIARRARAAAADDAPANGAADEEGEGLERASTRSAWKPRAGSLLAVLWPTVGDEFDAPAPAPEEEALPAAPFGNPLCRVPVHWSPVPLPAAPIAGNVRSSIAHEESPAFDWAGETARRVGTLVHAELQTMDPARSEETSIGARRGHFRRWLALRGVPEERLHEAVERVTAALIEVLRDPRGRWILKPWPRGDARECALSGQLHGAIVNVVFDRTFIDEAGIRWVIDYKTGRHAGGSAEEFLEREVERYRPQLERYAMLAQRLGPEPVRVGLYFPLLRAWREWGPG